MPEVGQQFAHFSQRLNILLAHPQCDPALGAEEVRQNGDIRAFRVFEEQCRSATSQGAIGNLGHLEIRVNLGSDSD